jgi:hypothetical protein
MRCQDDLKADNPLHPAPERRLPAFDLELLGIESYCGHRRVRAGRLVCRDVLRPQLEPASLPVCPVSETVYSKAQVGQDLVIDDIVQKNGVRVEGFLRQDDAIIE